MSKTIHNQPSLKSVLSLNPFKLSADQIKPIYPRAYALPAFFINNLVSKQRVVKIFTGPYAIVQAFAYQLMRLSLQIQSEEVDYRNIIYDSFVKYDLFEEGELGDQYLSDFQYRKFMKDFIEIVEAQDVANFQKNIEQYPIIHDILTNIFKAIVPYPSLINQYSENNQIDSFAYHILLDLCQMFKITLQKINNCFKFDQSDMFLYVQNKEEVYLAFIDQSKQQSQSSSFDSSLVCGEGNSFKTKYHSEHSSISKHYSSASAIKTHQRFLSINSFFKASGGNRTSPNKIMQRSAKIQTKLAQIGQQKQQSMKVIHPQSIKNPFKSLAQFLNKQQCQTIYTHTKQNSTIRDKDQLYDQFTSSFVLGQLDKTFIRRIRAIKSKYRQRQQNTYFTCIDNME